MPDTEEKKDTPQSEEKELVALNVKTIRLGGVLIISGTGTPLNIISAPLGSLYLNSSGGANTSIYVKETEVVTGDKTGWTAK